MQYVYPAIFYKDKKIPNTYTVIFPDVEGAATYGYSLYEALYMAEDSLAGMMIEWEDYKAGKSDTPMNNRIVEPTPIKDVVVEPNEYSTEAFVTLIRCNTDVYRKFLEEMPPSDKNDWEDLEVPEMFAREIYKRAGVTYQ